ncbi:MAG: hypothetical protein KAS32_01670 [Candidatus Peribacteraceae bacterium]|nr:hypothetical protein [Candidatus Peribacteraceae bacterium]
MQDIDAFDIPDEYRGHTVREIADLAPTGLDYYATIGGQEIHSNATIERYTMNWLAQHPTTKSVSRALAHGLETRKIVVGYQNTSKFKFAMFRMAKALIPSAGDGVMGYYSPRDKKLVILLDENVSFFGTALKELPPIVMHELIHMTYNHNPDLLLRATSRKTLIPWYKKVLTETLPQTSNIADSDIEKHIRELSYLSEAPNLVEPASIVSVGKLWMKLFSKSGVSDKDAEFLGNAMVLPYMAYIMERSVGSHRDTAKRMALRMYAAYNSIGINANKITMVGQEHIAVSEILAIQNMHKVRPEVASVVNSFRF